LEKSHSNATPLIEVSKPWNWVETFFCKCFGSYLQDDGSAFLDENTWEFQILESQIPNQMFWFMRFFKRKINLWWYDTWARGGGGGGGDFFCF
jgi:hypothetical protein